MSEITALTAEDFEPLVGGEIGAGPAGGLAATGSG